MYASQGDSITICWKLLPEANSSELSRITVMTLVRPAELEMKKVASAATKGKSERVFDRNHKGLYKDRVTVDADFQEKNLFFRITNYTSNMANVYCLLYEMSGSNDIGTCHTSAVFLGDIVGKHEAILYGVGGLIPLLSIIV